MSRSTLRLWCVVAGLSLAIAPRPRAEDPGQLSSLSSQGRSALRSLLEGGFHPDLAWPDFGPIWSDVERFYRDGGYALAWVRRSSPSVQARSAALILGAAAAKGLQPDDYDGPRWAERLGRLDGSVPPASELEQVRFDVALTVSLMRYLSDLAVGRVEPRRVRFELEVGDRGNLPELARQVATAADVGSAVARAEPPFAAYRRTLRALDSYSRLATEDDGELLPAARGPVRVGERYPGAPRLARLLRRVGDLPAAESPDPQSTLYDIALSRAVSRFQRRHGLEADGRLDARTLEQLNRPLSRRVAQLRLTLERWRWIPHRFSTPPIVVNIPEFRLHAGDAGERWSMKVVVGRAYRHHTPVFASEMRYVVFRPYWNVPLQIQRDEIAPRMAADPGFLAESGYELVDRQWRPLSTPGTQGELPGLLRSGGVRIRQRPGPRNALGDVKFVFPNRHDVYLHGTPSRELFQRARRDFSHGCIRVEDPAKLAAWLLRGVPDWTPQRVTAAMTGRETLQVNLPRPVPVLVLYGTAIVTDEGEVRFFEDIYGHDAALERALAERRPRLGRL